MRNIEYTEIPTNNLIQIPEKPPTSFSEAAWFFIVPTAVSLLFLAGKEMISNFGETAKTERELEAEQEKLERAERESLIKNLLEERQLLLKEVCSVKHDLACKNCNYIVRQEELQKSN